MSSLPVAIHPTAPLQEEDLRILAELAVRIAGIGLVVDCSNCGGAVPLTICQSDRSGNKGKPMARHYTCNFFRWFPQLRDFPRILAVIPPSTRSPDLSTSTLSHSAPPAKSTKSRQPRKQGKPCGGPFCKRRGALKCGRGMCLKHCQEVVGSCLFHSHGGRDDLDVDEDGLEATPLDPPPEQGSPIPSNNGLHDLQTALGLALTQRGIPLPTSNPDQFPSLHDILHRPASAVSSIATPTLPSPTHAIPPSSSLSQTSASAHLPPAPPPAPSETTTQQPRITQQLDKMWMSDLATRAQHEVEAQKVAERRREMERQLRQHFCLHYFIQDNAPAQSQWIANCPYYPQYRLSDDPDLVASLGLDCIEILDGDLHRWIGAPLNFDFTLKTACHLFVRCLGVTHCHDLDVLLAQSRQQVRPRHLRHNMKGERDAVRVRLHAKHSVFSEESDRDSDIEVISVRKRAREGSMDLIDRTPTRVRIAPPILSLSPSLTCFSPSPTCALLPVSPQQGSLPMLTPVTQPTSAEFSSPPPSVSDATVLTITPVQVPAYDHDVWPAGMYMVDMAAGFRQMKDKELRALYLQPALFQRIFRAPYIKGTYQENLRAWQKTNTDILDKFERAGRMPEGLWTRYLAGRRAALGEQSKRSSGPSKLRAP